MEQSGSQKSKSPSQLIDAKIKELGDWRGMMLYAGLHHRAGKRKFARFQRARRPPPVDIRTYIPAEARGVGVVALGPAQLEVRISAMSCAKIISSLPTTDGSAGEDR